MRRNCPVAYSPELGWSVFRHADIVRILHDHETFSNDVSRHLSVPNGMDPPDHAAFRRMIGPYFVADRVAEFEPQCRQIADELLEPAAARGRVEVMSELASRFAARCQCAFLGWPAEIHGRLIAWGAQNQQAIRQFDRPALAKLAAEFESIVTEQVQQRRQSPDDFPDVMLALMRERVHDRPLTAEELCSILRNWTVGEIGTIAASLGILLFHLSQSDQLQAQVRAAGSQLPAATDEILRVFNPLATNRRLTRHPVEIGGRRIDTGEQVMLHWIAANRDDEAFPDADQIRLDRDPSNNLLYGAGIHVCPGAPLARMELRVFLQSLFHHTSNVVPVANAAPVHATFPTSGFSSLPVQFETPCNHQSFS